MAPAVTQVLSFAPFSFAYFYSYVTEFPFRGSTIQLQSYNYLSIYLSINLSIYLLRHGSRLQLKQFQISVPLTQPSG